MISKEKFSMVIQEAIQKEQIGILVWTNWRTWESFRYLYTCSAERYEELLYSLQQGKDFHVYHGAFEFPSFIALPSSRLLEEEEFFNTVLVCIEKNHLEGPYILVPSMEFTDTLEEEDC